MNKQAASKPSLWWPALIRGLVLVIIGLAMFLWPGRSPTLLLQLLGVYWLIGGLLDLLEGTVRLVKGNIHRGQRSRLWLFLSALVSMAAGALLLSQPVLAGLLAGRFAMVLVGAAIAAVGAIRLWHGRAGDRSWRTVLVATTYVVLGVLVVANPLVAQDLVMLLLSAWAVAAGLLAIGTAFFLRRRPLPA